MKRSDNNGMRRRKIGILTLLMEGCCEPSQMSARPINRRRRPKLLDCSPADWERGVVVHRVLSWDSTVASQIRFILLLE